MYCKASQGFNKNNEFPKNLELAYTAPIYKRKDPLGKTNYRPVNALAMESKIFERIRQKKVMISLIISFPLFTWL